MFRKNILRTSMFTLLLAPFTPYVQNTVYAAESASTNQELNKQLFDAVNVTFHVDTNKIKTLVQQGADVNAHWTSVDPTTPMHLAARRGNAEVIKTLHELRADINARDQYGQSPLYWAITDLYTVKILIELEADITVTDNYGRTPRMYAEGCAHKYGFDVYNYLKSLEEK